VGVGHIVQETVAGQAKQADKGSAKKASDQVSKKSTKNVKQNAQKKESDANARIYAFAILRDKSDDETFANRAI